MANVLNRVEAAVPAVHLALEVCPLEVRPHERHLERVICHTRISKKGDYLYKTCLSIREKWKEPLSLSPFSSQTT